MHSTECHWLKTPGLGLMEIALRKLRGSVANRVQAWVSWLLNVGLLIADGTAENSGYQAPYLLCSFLMVVALLNTAHHIRNYFVVDVCHTQLHLVPNLWTRLLQGHGGFKLLNGLCALGAFVGALVLASEAQDQYDNMTVAVFATAFATINFSRTERDMFEADAWQASPNEMDERYLPVMKLLTRGTGSFALVNVLSTGFSVVSLFIGIAHRGPLELTERLLLALAALFLLISAVNASKMIRDAPGVNSRAWQLMTVASMLVSVTFCVAAPMLLPLSLTDRLFFETNFLWVLASTLTCSKVLRDRHEERRAADNDDDDTLSKCL